MAMATRIPTPMINITIMATKGTRTNITTISTMIRPRRMEVSNSTATMAMGKLKIQSDSRHPR